MNQLVPRKFLKLVSLLLATAMLVVACGDSSSDDVAEPGPSDSDSVSAGAGDSFTAVAPAILSSLDPERYEGNISLDILPNIAGTLLGWEKPTPDATAVQSPDEVVPALAESFQVEDDGHRIFMTLRDDAASPYGNTVTSEDVRWSFDRIINAEGGVPIGRILLDQAGWDLENPVEVVDDRSFYINVERPNAVSLSVVTTYFMMIYDTAEVSQHATDEDPWAHDWLGSNAASFGPYTVERLEPGREIQLVPNPGYYGDTPEMQSVVVRAIPDGNSRIQLLQRGEVDLAYNLSYDQLDSLQTNADVQLKKALFPSVMMMVLNHDVAPFDDARVRSAIAHAVNREDLIAAAYQGLGQPARDFFHQALGHPDPESAVQQDLERARELLDEAGISDLTLELSFNVGHLGPEVEQIAVLLKDQLAEIGIDLQINSMASSADFDAARREGALEAWFGTTAPQIPDVAYVIQTFFGTEGIVNTSRYGNAELDALAVDILETSPGDEREALVQQASELMLADMPMIPLVDVDKYYAFAADISGYLSYPQDSVMFMHLSRNK